MRQTPLDGTAKYSSLGTIFLIYFSASPRPMLVQKLLYILCLILIFVQQSEQKSVLRAALGFGFKCKSPCKPPI